MVNKQLCYGALFGDIVASTYEFVNRIKSRDFDLFNPDNTYTDDTIMTIASMDALLHNLSFTEAYRKWGNKYDVDSYGKMFHEWLGGENYSKDPSFGKSYGNGCAMRISPLAYFVPIKDLKQKISDSVRSSHDHPISLKAGETIVACYRAVFNGRDKQWIADILDKSYPKTKLEPFKRFSALAIDTVPIAIKCYLESSDIEDCIRTVVSLGGDCDTIGAMACEFWAARGEMTQQYVDYVESKIEPDMLEILLEFNKKVN